MDETEKISAEIRKALPQAKAGSLRIWGQWFGRPHDNIHTLVSCERQKNVLRLQFNDSEILSIWSPHGLLLDASTFRIADAQRVRWEWFFYGRPQISSNLYFEDYVKSAEGVSATTNVDWYSPNLKPASSEPAVEIL